MTEIDFDHYSPAHWKELAAGSVVETRSWISVEPTEEGQTATIRLNCEPKMTISTDLDQWGTYISFEIGTNRFTVAQEFGRMSFVDALMLALTKLKETTDFNTKPPVVKEVP